MDAVFPLFFVFFLLLAVVGFAFWLWTLVDALRYSDATWKAAEQEKVLWVVLIAVLGVIGSLIYVFLPRPALRRAAGR